MLGNQPLGQATSIEGLSKIIGCTKQHIYKYNLNNHFNYKKNNYTIIDRLDF